MWNSPLTPPEPNKIVLTRYKQCSGAYTHRLLFMHPNESWGDYDNAAYRPPDGWMYIPE